MLEASRVRLPGVEEGASEAGGSTGSRQGRRQERAEVEARAELRTPARGAGTELRTPDRGADGAADAGEGDPEVGCRRLRERAAAARERSGSWQCGCNSHWSLTHSSSSYPNGSAKGGPNSLAGPNSPSPELVVRLV